MTIFVSGETKFVEQFLDKLKSEAPAGAFVEEFTCELMPEQEFSGFSIVESDCPGEKREYREFRRICQPVGSVWKNCTIQKTEDTVIRL